MKYAIHAGKLTVKARSRVHDTTTVWDKITGGVDADPDAIEAAKATFAVDMTSFDAGDWLKNRKLRKDFDMDAHQAATITLQRVSSVVPAPLLCRMSLELPAVGPIRETISFVAADGADSRGCAPGNSACNLQRVHRRHRPRG